MLVVNGDVCVTRYESIQTGRNVKLQEFYWDKICRLKISGNMSHSLAFCALGRRYLENCSQNRAKQQVHEMAGFKLLVSLFLIQYCVSTVPVIFVPLYLSSI